MKKFIFAYYPLILAFISFLFSVTLWFTGNQLEGIFVGIWVPSILSLTSVLADIRQSESRKKGTSNQREEGEEVCLFNSAHQSPQQKECKSHKRREENQTVGF